jgi:hypothetical protein
LIWLWESTFIFSLEKVKVILNTALPVFTIQNMPLLSLCSLL